MDRVAHHSGLTRNRSGPPLPHAVLSLHCHARATSLVHLVRSRASRRTSMVRDEPDLHENRPGAHTGSTSVTRWPALPTGPVLHMATRYVAARDQTVMAINQPRDGQPRCLSAQAARTTVATVCGRPMGSTGWVEMASARDQLASQASASRATSSTTGGQSSTSSFI